MYRQRRFPSILLVLIFCIITAVILGAVVYYYSIGKTEVYKKQKDEELENLKKENETFKVENEQLKADLKNDINSWEIYTSTKYNFSVKYPMGWIYKDDYSLKKDLVAFAFTESELPKTQTDEFAEISVRIVRCLKDKERTNSPDKLKKEEITIGDEVKASKITLEAGREDDLAGDNKIVSIEVSCENNKVISIENVDDWEKDIFEKMLQTFRLLE